MAEELAPVFLMLGGIFALGLVADSVARRTAIPRVSLLLLFGGESAASAFEFAT